MFFNKKIPDNTDAVATLKALDRSQAMIEFTPDGTILTANQNFLQATGYTLDEIKGKHHSIFVEPQYAKTQEYHDFWQSLAQGKFQSGQYKRVGKDSKEVWTQASYNPVMDTQGKVFKVVTYATDITQQKLINADLVGQIDAMSKSQAFIAKQMERNVLVKRIVGENMGQVEQAISNVSHQSTHAASAAVEASANVQAVAAAAEEFNASVKEIAENMVKSKDAVEKVVDQTALADQSTQRLVATSQSMGNIVELIQSIAGQINLLALNATIESARAGEAGKGFAVVASEVKSLAGQTAKATEQISKEIEGMQSVSSDVVNSLNTIKSSIELVRQYVTGVAGAIEEQSAVTREISSNMQMASTVMNSISEDVSSIVTASGAAATAAQEAAKVLAD